MSEARIRWISGPVLRAGTKDAFHVNESITVGPSALLGEVIKLGSGEFVAQIYEDTTGLKPGDSVAGSGEPLSIVLGPSLLGTICDGLLRPLDALDGAFIRPGATRRAPRRFGFEPAIASGRPRAPRPSHRQDRNFAGAILSVSAKRRGGRRALGGGCRRIHGSRTRVPTRDRGTRGRSRSR